MINIVNDLIEIAENTLCIRCCYLFGSRAKGTQREDSDYDLCIIVENEKNKPEIINALGSYMVKNKIIIHPFVFTQKEFEYRKNIGTHNRNIVENGRIIFNR